MNANQAINLRQHNGCKLAHLAAKAKKSGNHVYHLNIGQPDIESPPEFFEGLREYKQNSLM